MTLPGYAAGASLYTTSRSYRGGRCGTTAVDEGLTVVPQHDPCAIGGGGGIDLPPTACKRGTRCCGIIMNDSTGRPRCEGHCLPFNFQCP